MTRLVILTVSTHYPDIEIFFAILFQGVLSSRKWYSMTSRMPQILTTKILLVSAIDHRTIRHRPSPFGNQVPTKLYQIYPILHLHLFNIFKNVKRSPATLCFAFCLGRINDFRSPTGCRPIITMHSAYSS